MIVRAVTLGIDLEWPPEPEMLARAAGALGALVRLLQEAGHEVQTSRVALAPYYERLPPDRAAALPRAAEEIEAELNGLGVGYVSFGPIRWRTLGDDLAAQYVPIVTDALHRHLGIFLLGRGGGHSRDSVSSGPGGGADDS